MLSVAIPINISAVDQKILKIKIKLQKSNKNHVPLNYGQSKSNQSCLLCVFYQEILIIQLSMLSGQFTVLIGQF